MNRVYRPEFLCLVFNEQSIRVRSDIAIHFHPGNPLIFKVIHDLAVFGIGQRLDTVSDLLVNLSHRKERGYDRILTVFCFRENVFADRMTVTDCAICERPYVGIFKPRNKDS